MNGIALKPRCQRLKRLAKSLLQDRAGNTIVLVAAAILPLLALVGSGVDMGRSYLVQSRLQRACDAGVLSGRKELATFANFDSGADTMKVEDQGDRFFNANFPTGIYGTRQRAFKLEIGSDYAVRGTASAIVPTTIMKIFNFSQIPVSVDCTAQLDNANTDIMMALDVTGSMNQTLAGDSQSKLATLKSTVKGFYTSIMANKVAGSTIRMGFVPYSTNVNVGAILKDDWVAPEWNYDTRVLNGSGDAFGTTSFWGAWSPVSGSSSSNVDQTYTASFDSRSNTYRCLHSLPTGTGTNTTKKISTSSEDYAGPPSGTKTTDVWNRTRDGSFYSVALKDKTCVVTRTTYDNYIDTIPYITIPTMEHSSKWDYKSLSKDVSDWRTGSNGCMEERATYDIDDYDNVDLSQALDLDIDGVPDAGDTDTQWKPEYPDIIYDRALQWNGRGTMDAAESTTNAEYVAPGLIGLAACPAPAKKLQEWSKSNLDSYVDSLSAGGSTYHDIGLLWAARLISPKGLFANENTVDGKDVNRHLIFLTDGQTATLDLSYGAYGVEPLSHRRWNPSDSLTLNQTVEKRFSFVCNEVKNHNITV
ncbi:Tad domain-containing protein [Novosphingobium sp. ZN18A2]|uniref:Tad domain-containing protein n=1 Tax=Novosphingobium sp. ZN18A2 TaxID=3079861 RepID=UPI0030D53830